MISFPQGCAVAGDSRPPERCNIVSIHGSRRSASPVTGLFMNSDLFSLISLILLFELRVAWHYLELIHAHHLFSALLFCLIRLVRLSPLPLRQSDQRTSVPN